MGFDFVMVDTQHGRWADEKRDARVQRHRAGVICADGQGEAQRLRTHRPSAGHGLHGNSGADGEQQPRRLRQRCSRRGTRPSAAAPSARSAQGFTAKTTSKKANDEVFLAVQIETDEGAKNAEDIMAVDGIDGCWIGPGDLSRFMRLDLSTE